MRESRSDRSIAAHAGTICATRALSLAGSPACTAKSAVIVRFTSGISCSSELRSKDSTLSRIMFERNAKDTFVDPIDAISKRRSQLRGLYIVVIEK
jgi:hypothetical protein